MLWFQIEKEWKKEVDEIGLRRDEFLASFIISEQALREAWGAYSHTEKSLGRKYHAASFYKEEIDCFYSGFECDYFDSTYIMEKSAFYSRRKNLDEVFLNSQKLLELCLASKNYFNSETEKDTKIKERYNRLYIISGGEQDVLVEMDYEINQLYKQKIKYINEIRDLETKAKNLLDRINLALSNWAKMYSKYPEYIDKNN